MKNKFLLLLIIITGFLLRFFYLDKFPLWPDELASLERASQLTLPELMRELKGNQPLYEFFLHFWVRLGDSDFFIRLPSVIFGILGILFLYRMVRDLTGEKEALLSAVLLTLSPLHVLFSRINRVYSLLTLLVILSWWYLWRWWEKGEKRAGFYYILFTALSLYAHFSAYLSFMAQFLWGIVEGGRRKKKKKEWLAFLGVYSSILFLVLPWLFYSFYQVVKFSTGAKYYSSQAGKILKLMFLPFSLYAGLTLSPFRLLLIIPGVLTLLYILVKSLSGSRKPLLFLLLWFLIPLFGGWKIPAVSPKHLIYLLPPLYILISCGVIKMEKKKEMFLLPFFFLPIFVSLGNLYLGKEYVDASMVTPWERIATFIQEREKEGEEIWVESNPRFPYGMRVNLFRRYYKGKLPVLLLPAGTSPDFLLERKNKMWILLYEGEEREKWEKFLWDKGKISLYKGFQWEVHTLKGLREGWKNRNKYASFLYHLYLWEKR